LICKFLKKNTGSGLPPPEDSDDEDKNKYYYDDTDDEDGKDDKGNGNSIAESGVSSLRALSNPHAVLDEINRDICVNDDDMKLSKAILEKVLFIFQFLFHNIFT
jgi:hypothetical protein